MLYTQWGPFCALVLTQIYIWTDSWLSSASNHRPGIVLLKSWNAMWLCVYSGFHIWGINNPHFSRAGKLVQWVSACCSSLTIWIGVPRTYLTCGDGSSHLWSLGSVSWAWEERQRQESRKKLMAASWLCAAVSSKRLWPKQTGGQGLAWEVVLRPPHTGCGTCVPTCMNIHKQTTHI